MILGKLSKPIFLLFITVFVCSNLKAETKDQHIKVTLRAIAHEFLLELHDTTSRVLPIEKIGQRYEIRFEREFSFEPDLLVLITWQVLEKSKIKDNYIVEVEKCSTKEVVHSFLTDLSKQDSTTACRTRLLPEDCYVFYYTLVDSDSLAGMAENNTQEFAKDESKKEKENSKNSSSVYIFILIILLVGFGALVFFKTKKKKSTSTLIQIGKFQFDQKSMLLQLKAQSIELSSKEADLLFLLFSNENKTLEREYILNVVWGDTGDYVGRTLDVFISKLRKKLEADASLKIINIRGVGYKFVMG